MFDFIEMRLVIILLISLLAFRAKAQENFCQTRLSEKQLYDLHVFQQKLEVGKVALGLKSTVYVPLKIHIIGNSEGVGYYSVTMLMNTLCELNERFLPVGFHFYLADSVSYIDDNDLYNGNSDAIWLRSENYKLSDAVNVFFHGSGMQWCGVYFPGVDVVFIKNGCQQKEATTLTHELGHFFSLPHTFSGWENDNIPVEIEKLDQSNCRSAGDGFCDTRADYVSQRWSCPLPWNLVDPDNKTFKPDSSLYMSYSSDNCQSRFSIEQTAAMQSNLQSRGIGKISVDSRLLPAPEKLFPLPGDSNLNADAVLLKWKSVPGAFAYHVQVARFGNWEYLNFDRLVYDTSALADLFGNWQYAWRVKAIAAGNTCSSFGLADTFYTIEKPTGHGITDPQSGISFYPNPVNSNERIYLNGLENAEIRVFSISGKLMISDQVLSGTKFEFSLPDPGFYLIEITSGQKKSVSRLLVK